MNDNTNSLIFKITDENDWLNIIDNINTPIINLYDDFYNEERYIIVNNNNLTSAFKYIDTKNFGTLIFWGKSLHKSLIFKEIHSFITKKLYSKSEYYKISVQLFSFQKKYISFFESIGFKVELYLKEHIKIRNMYFDILALSIDNENIKKEGD